MKTAWIHYPLRFRLLSPLHVGYRRMGNLMQTRPYVPGKPLWAALTARLTRNAYPDAKQEHYRDMGKQVQKYFRFGYLWPSLDRQTPCFSWTHHSFDFTFLSSYASTALDYGRNAAAEGALHEIEFLAPATREEGHPVYLLGDLWIWEDALSDELANWQEALNQIQLGGERSYGWGQVRLVPQYGRRGPTLQASPGDSGYTVTGFPWKNSGGEVALSLSQESHLPAHALAAGEGAVSHEDIRGSVETLSGWQRALRDANRTWDRAEVRLAHAPGADVIAEEDLGLIIRPWGVMATSAEPLGPTD